MCIRYVLRGHTRTDRKTDRQIERRIERQVDNQPSRQIARERRERDWERYLWVWVGGVLQILRRGFRDFKFVDF